MSFKGFQQTGVYGLTRKPTNLFGGVPSNISNVGSLQYSNLPNLVGWYNNSDGVTTATGVSAWVDRVSATSLAQGTGASQPSYTQQVQTLNGYSKTNFATAQNMSAGDVFDIRTNTGYTVQMYGKITTMITNRLLIGKSVNNAAPTLAGEYQLAHNGTNLVARFFDNVSLKTTGAYTFDVNNYYLYSIVIDITNSLLSLYVNEKAVATAAISNTVVDYNNGSAFGIGSSSTGCIFEALEVLIYQTALSQSEISQNLLALKNKFGQI